MFGLSVFALVTLALGMWIWAGQAGSTDDALRLAQRWVPSLGAVQWQGAHGAVREGAVRFERLEWSDGTGLRVRGEQVAVRWSWPALWAGRLELHAVQAQSIAIEDRRTARSTALPPHLELPVPVRATVSIGRLHWSGSADLVATEVGGHYEYDGQRHRLHGLQARIAAGRYGGEASLSAQPPLAVAVRATGTVSITVDGRADPLPVHASAELSGALAGTEPRLAFSARLHPSLKTGTAPQATVNALVSPWAVQPVTQARIQVGSLDLAVLWPGMPATRLDGTAQVHPHGTGWAAAADLRNSLPGAWDHQRLPFERLTAQARLAGDGGWQVDAASATGAGGRLWLDRAYRGAQPAASAGWSVVLRGERVDPARILSTLPSTALDGQLQVDQANGALVLQGQARSSAGARALPGAITLHRAQWQVTRRGSAWDIRQLDLQTADATLTASGLFDATAASASGQVSATWPGAHIQVRGQLAATQGGGQATADVTDAQQAGRWLRRWPAVGRALGGQQVDGKLSLQATWTGGWQDQGRGLHVDAAVQAPQLSLLGADATPGSTWRDLRLRIRGTAAAMDADAQGRWHGESLTARWQVRATASRARSGDWHGRLESAQVQRQDSGPLGTVTARLSAPVSVQWQADSRRLHVDPGQVQMSGPGPQPGRVEWTALGWSGASNEWQGRGRIDGLPLSWVDGIDALDGRSAGLRGDLELGGEWSARVLPGRLQLRAELARTRGDLLLATEADDGGTTMAAGIRQARLLVTVDDLRADAALQWTSEHAGEASARIGTVLAYHPDTGWHWPAQAPLQGTLAARLPRLGVWAVLAPPGWRVRGTLDAQATLGGTRAAPVWQGHLNADDLAVRSAVQGVEFTQGQLRTRLSDNRIDITSLRLRGAGARGGQLDLSGQAQWLSRPSDQRSSLPLAPRIQVQLDANAQALRVSARADRRLTVSGQVQARLDSGRLSVTGSLRADQALFVLPEEDTPVLGADVVVRGRNAPSVQPAASTSPPAAGRTLPLSVSVDVALDPGSDFQVQGKGLTTRLAGSVRLRNDAGTVLQPQLFGELRTVAGSYRAYGQVLDIATGRLRFTGAWDNPALDLLAIRPNLEQKVGVQVRGTALAPVVRLWAEPDLPEPDKLAWLILGRGAAQGGAESAVLQQAALALLGNKGGLAGGLAQAFGLDEFSVRGSNQTNLADLSGATVTVGKRLSRNFYVSYERSLTGTLGTLFIFYDLTRRLTLRAQTGEQSAVDLIWTIPFN